MQAMKSQEGFQISRRSLLGVLGLLAVRSKRSIAEALWQTPAPQAARLATVEDRHWAKQPVVPNKVKDTLQPLGYSSQQLHPESFLGKHLDLNTQIGLLKAVDVDSYLRAYREGKRPFWPAGEYLGKFMQGFSRMYLYSGDAELLDRMQVITKTWVTSQRA